MEEDFTSRLITDEVLAPLAPIILRHKDLLTRLGHGHDPQLYCERRVTSKLEVITLLKFNEFVEILLQQNSTAERVLHFTPKLSYFTSCTAVRCAGH